MNFDNIKWNEKGLIPAVIQDDVTSSVLMLGYMNQESLNKSLKTNEVTFFSRSKKRLWTKGEESGNKLIIQNIVLDCDRDTLLIQATPLGPTCHTGTISCFGDDFETCTFCATAWAGSAQSTCMPNKTCTGACACTT